MPEDPLLTLARWEDAGAHWRTTWISGDEVVVELISCLGEPVDWLRSRDPALLAHVRERPSSEP